VSSQASASLAQGLLAGARYATLAYIIKRQSGDFVYTVPLLKDYLYAQSDGDPAAMLAFDAGDWREEFSF